MTGGSVAAGSGDAGETTDGGVEARQLAREMLKEL